MKKLLYLGAFCALLLVGCGDEKESTNEPSSKKVEEVEESKSLTWLEEINAIATSEDVASDKYYKLEKYMSTYETNEENLKQFKQDILKAYEDKTYLGDIENHELMLTQIFKSFIVERNETNEWKDFAFDFHQNVKYVYRGVDTVDSDSVKSNEIQMNKFLENLK